MAESEGSERTESATPRRREKAREEGQVAKSQEINSVAILVCGFLFVLAAVGWMGARLQGVGVFFLTEAAQVRVENLSDASAMLFTAGQQMASALAPVLLGLLLVALAIGYAQVGFKWSNKAYSFKLEKLNPIEGVKNRFFSKTTWFELAKNLFKVAILGSIAGFSLVEMVPEFVGLSQYSLMDGWEAAVRLLAELLLRMLAALLILALVDLWWQRHRHEEQLKMTKEEVKREMKDAEGDPQIKARLRSIMIEQVKRRMLEDVKTADVVITNPTHYSIALSYHAEEGAPKVVAKGQGHLALRIREIAAEHRVPLVANPPLARALFRTAEIGAFVPFELYESVAQVLAAVFRADRARSAAAGVS